MLRGTAGLLALSGSRATAAILSPESAASTTANIGTRDAEWVDALHRIGLLTLVERKPEVRRVKRREPVIRQRATKTTPTCLSSYLG